MRTRKVGALVVTNARKPIGIITDRDITVDVVAAGNDPAATTVSKVMHRNPRVLREDQGLFDAVKTFSGTGVRRLPVVNRAGMVKGIIALSRSLGRPVAAA